MADNARRSDFDDVADDAASAYREAASRVSEPATTAPATVEPATTVGEANDGKAPAEGKATDGDGDKSGTNRDARGRFAPKDGGKGGRAEGEAGDKAAGSEGDGKAAAPEAGEPKAEAAPAVTSGPPPSWSVKAKAAWDALPADVRADIAKRETEMANGLAALRDYKDLKPFAERAQREGTTIAAALDRYVKLEDVLRKNVGAGLAVIAQNFGLNQQQAAQLFANLARQLGAPGSPAALGNGHAANGAASAAPSAADDPLVSALAPVLAPLRDELSSLKGQLAARADADRKATERSLGAAIEKFAANPANRFFPELEETMTRLMESGIVPMTGNHESDLRAAYDLAAYQHPEVREALIEQRLEERRAAERKKEQEEADKAKLASRSVTGSRLPGTTIEAAQYANAHDEIEAVARAAYRQHSQR